MPSFNNITMPRKQDIAQQEQAVARKKKRFQEEEARYTLIWHTARKKLSITINEYCLADTINKLSGNRSSVPGWCYAKKDHLAKVLGFSRQSIHSMVKNLIELELVEKSEETGYLRTTQQWYENVETFKEKLNES